MRDIGAGQWKAGIAAWRGWLFDALELRTTGAGSCFNLGRLAAAFASVAFGWLAPVGNFRLALLASSTLALAAALWAWWLPESPDDKKQPPP